MPLFDARSELQQLKDRINKSGEDGIPTAIIHDDYSPAGALMIKGLLDTGEYVTRKVPPGTWRQEWRIFRADKAPY